MFKRLAASMRGAIDVYKVLKSKVPRGDVRGVWIFLEKWEAGKEGLRYIVVVFDVGAGTVVRPGDRMAELV